MCVANIKEERYSVPSFYSGSSAEVDGFSLYVDGIFVKRSQELSHMEALAGQVATHPDYICLYAGVFDCPYEIVDMLIRRNMNFLDARLIAEETRNGKIRYIFSGNISGVSCAFRFTLFNKVYAEKLSQYIKDNKKSSDILISFNENERV